jgi:hypothetical protein
MILLHIDTVNFEVIFGVSCSGLRVGVGLKCIL